MRVFFALEPPTQTSIAIADWRDRNAACDGRPVPMANFHITLAFAGELAETRIERLCDAAERWQGRIKPGDCQLQLDQVGYWPRPGIYWLGPKHWPDHVQQLSAALCQAVVAAGGKRERNRFTPHVTLYRGCHTAPSAPSTAPAIDFDCDHFSLCESRQGRAGVSYHTLCEWPL